MYKPLCDPTCIRTYHRVAINDAVLLKSITWEPRGAQSGHKQRHASHYFFEVES
jgi:hypothetical protein